jgi:hypothetical protein
MRFGEKPARWIAKVASERGDMNGELLDLRNCTMPFFDAANAFTPSKNDVAQTLATQARSV